MLLDSTNTAWKTTTLFVLVLAFQSIFCVYMIYMVDAWKIKYTSLVRTEQCETVPKDSEQPVTQTNVIAHQAHVTNTQTDDRIEIGKVCANLIAGDASEVNRSLAYMVKHPRKELVPEAYPAYTRDCEWFTKQAGFITKSTTREEKDFPIAFSVLVFKDVEQVEMLLRAIYRPHNVYCIHIDKKSPIVFVRAIKAIAKCLPNVFIEKRPVDVQWGKYSVLEADLHCMDSLLSHWVRWKYFINLTGQEYPLKTNYELVQILKRYKGANDIAGGYKGVYSNRWKDRDKIPHGIVPKKGPVHITATRGFVRYVRTNKKALDYLEWLKDTHVPDETFFASINYNPHLKVPGTYKGNVLLKRPAWYTRFKIWQDWAKPCFGKFAHHVCIFGVKDLPRLTEVPYLFANKFHYDFQPLVLDCLQVWYFDKVQKEQQGQLQFDTSLYTRKQFYFDKQAM